MELRHIRYFLAVARERNFTRAAVHLNIGQPPLSNQIKDLEREVGASLLHRTAHGADLTPAGQAFHDVVTGIPALTERAIRNAQLAARGELGCLCIGFSASSAFNPVVPAAVRAFQSAYPGVKVELEESNTVPLVAALLEGKIDVAFVRPGDTTSHSVKLRMMSAEPLIVALPKDHPATADDEIDLARLAKDRFILFPRCVSPDFYETIIRTLQEAGIEPAVDQVVGQLASIVGFVAAGLGVSIMTASMHQVDIPGVTFRAIKNQSPAISLAIAYRPKNSSVLVRNFLSATRGLSLGPESQRNDAK